MNATGRACAGTGPRGGRTSVALAAALLAASLPAPAQADGSGWIRPYLSLRTGGAIFTDTEPVGGVKLDSPTDEAVLAAAAGFDWGRYWGAELAVDFVESSLHTPGLGRVAEYATWTVLGQVRGRYPLWDDRLVPYLLVGAGVGTGELNDRKVSNEEFSLRGSLDSTFVGAVGGGLEYFVARNIALGLEVKHRFLFDTEIEVEGRTHEINLDSLTWAGGLRIYFDGSEDAEHAPPAADSDALRAYLALHAGGVVFTSSNDAAGVELVSPMGPAGAAAVGVNFNKYVGIEGATSYIETDVEAPGAGTVGEYTIVTGTAQLRLRYPVMDDRVTPYLVAGGGLGFGEFNDRSASHDVFSIEGGRDTVPVATLGGGVEYFIAENMALGVEAKHVFLFDIDAEVNGRATQLELDSVFLTAGLRIFFP